MSLTNLYFALISLFVVTFYSITAVYFPQLYIFGTYEDMYGEWVQVFFFLATFIFAALNATHSEAGRFKLFFGVLAVAAFYTFMEEISWGQRLIGFDTPEFFEKHSYQNEANLHNLLTGPVESWTKTLLTYLIAAGLFGYGIVFPLMLKNQTRLALWFDKWGCPAPPLGLIPAFIFSVLFELEFFSFNEAEVAELLVAMAICFTSLHYWLNKHSQWQSKGLYFFIFITLIVTTSAFFTTQTLINNPSQESKITRRLSNGYKKFADRYDRYEHYQATAEVLQLYNQIKPNNTVVLRRLRERYLLLDNIQEADQALEQAIQVALKRLQSEPENIPTLISLAKSYHEYLRPDLVYLYAQRANQLALRNISNNTKKHNQAYWHYWLAKSCEQLNKQPEALKYFRKAHKLAPKHRRYKRAYYKKRHLMEKYYAEDWAESLYSS